MAVEQPYAEQNLTYSAEQLRRGTYSPMLQRGSTVGSVVGGLVGSGDFLVTYSGSGLGVTVAVGEAVVPGSSSGSQSGYLIRGTSSTALSPAAASASNPRVDLVYLQINDAAYSGGTNNGTCSIATGTPTGGASLANLSGAPSLPTSSLALAYVLIPQSATTITNSDIQNLNSLFYGSSSCAALGLNIYKGVNSSSSTALLSGQHMTVFSGSGAYTLPAPFANAHCRVTNYGSGVPTVAQHASEVIYGLGMGSGGVTSFPLGTYGATATVESDGVNWFITAGAQDTGWLTQALTAPYTGPLKYRKVANRVSFSGDLNPNAAASGSAVCTLAAGFWPAGNADWEGGIGCYGSAPIANWLSINPTTGQMLFYYAAAVTQAGFSSLTYLTD